MLVALSWCLRVLRFGVFAGRCVWFLVIWFEFVVVLVRLLITFYFGVDLGSSVALSVGFDGYSIGYLVSILVWFVCGFDFVICACFWCT